MRKEQFEKEIREALAGARYCFPRLQMDGRTEFPKPDMEEFPDFVQFILNVVSAQRKRSFFEGFKAGAKAMFLDLKPADMEFDASVAEIGAWEAWEEFDGLVDGVQG